MLDSMVMCCGPPLVILPSIAHGAGWGKGFLPADGAKGVSGLAISAREAAGEHRHACLGVCCVPLSGLLDHSTRQMRTVFFPVLRDVNLLFFRCPWARAA